MNLLCLALVAYADQLPGEALVATSSALVDFLIEQYYLFGTGSEWDSDIGCLRWFRDRFGHGFSRFTSRFDQESERFDRVFNLPWFALIVTY